MGQEKEINIKNQKYYFFDDMIDIRNLHKDIDIYYASYITIKKFGDCENFTS